MPEKKLAIKCELEKLVKNEGKKTARQNKNRLAMSEPKLTNLPIQNTR